MNDRKPLREPLERPPAEFDERPDPVTIGPEYSSRITLQRYGARPRIVGVQFLALERHVDDGGSFLEISRCKDGVLQHGPNLHLRQINYAVMEPHTIKAFHLHQHQSEFWFVPPESRILVGLHDVRAASSSYRLTMRFILGDGNPRLLYIPAGVAHGASNPSNRQAQILYMTDQEFDPDPGRCDERRLPWDLLGESFWELERT